MITVDSDRRIDDRPAGDGLASRFFMGVWLGGAHHSGWVRSLDRCMIGFVFFFVSSLVAGDWPLFLMLNLVKSLIESLI